MIVQLLVRAFFFYLVFIIIRGAWRLFKSVEYIKRNAQRPPSENSRGEKVKEGDVFEAEFKVKK